MTSWTARDLAKSLIISPAAAKQALTILEMQGYVKPTGSAEWITTPAGEIVSGSKLPRYTRETVGRSLESFADHLQRVNEDARAKVCAVLCRRELWRIYITHGNDGSPPIGARLA